MANLSRLFRSNKVFLIIFSVLILARAIISALFFYKYINFSSIKEVKKWGTLVEWIYEPISYLPYWWDHEKNHFYQTILFPGCEWWIDGSLCDIQTTDNKVYSIKIKTGIQRSDKEPFVMDDIIFSYQDIVISNLWEQPYLSQYQDIFMSEDEKNPNTLLVTFPTEDAKNRDFFKLPIIPYHSMKDLDLQDYVKRFALKPVTIGCVQLKTSNDADSLIFDFSTCKNTYINYYQLKSFEAFEHLQTHLQSIKNIISFYYGNAETEWYHLLPIQDNYFLTMFFNTKSTKLSPRIQRALWWFVQYNLRQQWHTGYISPYTWLLSHYQSTWTNLWDYIKNKNPYLSYDKSLLEQWGVRSIPSVFTIDWAKRKSAFYLDATEQKEYTFAIETTDPVYELKAKTDKSVRYLTTRSENNNKKHFITFSIGDGQQIVEWLNSITVGGTVLGKKQTVANIDIYYLGKTSNTNTFNKLKIITLDNKISNYLRTQLKDIFIKNNIQDLFDFVVYNNKDDFINAINTKDYDIVLSTIKMESLADVHTILNSQDPQINPSLYFNPTLNQFVAENKRNDVRNIFSTEMPFFIVGQMMKPYRLRDDVIFNYTWSYDESTIKDIIIRNVSIVSRNQIKWSDLVNPSNMMNFIKQQKN
jgi:hypothetical protein